MKTINKNLVLALLFSALPFSFSLQAQMPFTDPNEPRIIGWSDDTHYLLQTVDETKHKIVKNVDIKTGKSVILPDYQNEMDILRVALPAGITMGMGDEVSDDKKAVVITRNTDLWYFKIGDASARQLTQDLAEEKNPRISPDGTKVAYTKNKDLYVYDLVSGKEIRLTNDATDRIYNGWASWVYYEEILQRSSKYAAFWWSPDSKKVAYLHTDDNPVPEYTLNALKSSEGPRGRLEVTPYPKAGDPNPKVKMGVAEISTGKTVWVKTDESVDQYIAWPSWTPDSRKLMVQVLNRDQNDMRFILADITTGDYSEIYRETCKTWVEFFEDIYVMKDGSGFILRSYKSDWYNLYYYGWDGKLISQITNVNWKVSEVVKVDEAGKKVYFKGTGPESTDSHFFCVGLDGKNLTQITTGAGTHNVNMSPKGSYFLDNCSSITSPGGIYAIDKKAKIISTVYQKAVIVFDPSTQSRSELVKIKTSDGLFDMPAIITYPVNFDPSQKYPVVFSIYGGPNAGFVRNSWNGNKPQWFAQNGIVVISVDHRGSGHFGKKGSDYMYRCLGKWEISDYSDAVKWLWEKPWVDKTRIGMEGGSYGGYTTCMALTKGADFWSYGIADYSVTDWSLYDNVYTERFMDTPQDNPEGYKEASVLTYTSSYKGKLLIRHGDMDDNVHMQNSIWLISALQDLNKPFEFMVYPGERHGWGGTKRAFFTEEANRFWLKSFFGK
jgi:dipeptidyl-peptidase 4